MSKNSTWSRVSPASERLRMAKNLLTLARALFGFFRFNAGVFLLKVWFGLRRYSKRPPDFHSGWRVAKKLGWLFRGREFVVNRFRQHWYQFAMSKLLAEFRNHDIRGQCGQAGSTHLATAAAPTLPQSAPCSVQHDCPASLAPAD